MYPASGVGNEYVGYVRRGAWHEMEHRRHHAPWMVWKWKCTNCERKRFFSASVKTFAQAVSISLLQGSTFVKVSGEPLCIFAHLSSYFC